MILDRAGAKGTGKWTSQDAMDIPVAIPVIDMAVVFRTMSNYMDERKQAAKLYQPKVLPINEDKNSFIQSLKDALYVATIICYAQGLAMLQKGSELLKMEIPLKDVVKIWRGGCIIRSGLLEIFYECFQKNPQLTNILLDENIIQIIQSKQQSIRNVVIQAIQSNIAVGGLASVIAYLDAFANERMPTNLIQAQRDYFGAHTYQRIDKEGYFHTEWIGLHS